MNSTKIRWWKRVNWTYVTVALIVRMFMVGAAVVSFSHIIDVSQTLGLTWEAYTVPAFVDGLAVLGMIGRSAKFAESTQKAGLQMMAGAGVISLACNVAAGDNRGQQAYGVLVVAGFIAAEWYATKLRPAPEPVTRKCPDGCTCRRHVKAKVLTPAQKAAITRARKKADKELAAMAGGYVPEDAPVSPALA
jgi:hypothetical protein